MEDLVLELFPFWIPTIWFALLRIPTGVKVIRVFGSTMWWRFDWRWITKEIPEIRTRPVTPQPSHWLTLFIRNSLGSPLNLMLLDCGRKLEKTCADMRRTFKCHIERPDLDSNPPHSGLTVTGAITAPLSGPHDKPIPQKDIFDRNKLLILSVALI